MNDSSSSRFEETPREWDVVVVGAGVAGAIAAREIARQGVSVLLVDKATFPRFKVCGGCLNLGALGLLDEIGLAHVPRDAGGIELNRFHVASLGAMAKLDLPGGMAVVRSDLDEALVREAVKEGATFLDGTRAALRDGTDEGWSLRLQHDVERRSVWAKIVLAADGLGGKLLQKAESFDSVPAKQSLIGAGTVADEWPPWCDSGAIYMACGRGGYVGCTAATEDRAIIGAALSPSFVKESGGLHEGAEKIVAEAGFPPLSKSPTMQWRGTALLTRQATRLSAHRCFVLGDAAGYVEPFTGEGMVCAVSCGVAVARLVCRSVNNFGADTEREWAACYRSIVSDTQGLCKAIAAGLRRPLLVKTAIRAVAFAPRLASPFLRRLNSPRLVHKEA